MADVPCPQVLRVWRKGKESIDFPLREQLPRVRRRAGDPDNVPAGVEPNVSEHRCQIHMLARAYCLHANVSAFEVGNAADPLVREQFEAADVHAREGYKRFAGVNRD